jgi:hypothetical protein
LRQRAVVSEDGFIAIERLQTIFSTFEIIMKANYTFLKKLHVVIRSWNVETIIGPLFVELVLILLFLFLGGGKEEEMTIKTYTIFLF